MQCIWIHDYVPSGNIFINYHSSSSFIFTFYCSKIQRAMCNDQSKEQIGARWIKFSKCCRLNFAGLTTLCISLKSLKWLHSQSLMDCTNWYKQFLTIYIERYNFYILLSYCCCNLNNITNWLQFKTIQGLN